MASSADPVGFVYSMLSTIAVPVKALPVFKVTVKVPLSPSSGGSSPAFRKALKDFRGSFDIGDGGLDNYPKTYPALIVLNNQYNGGNYINTCKLYPLHLLKQIVDIMENT